MSTEYYAYQVALKTLKERCDYLQNKLNSTEEENCNLKQQISEGGIKNSPTAALDEDQLRLQISALTQQKVKLNSQVQIVTAENRNLWSRLSKFTSDTDYLESKLSFKEDPMKYQDRNICLDNHSDLEMSKVTISPDGSRESLEEISLKLNALISEKRGLPAEFPNTLDLYVYKNTLPLENYAFSLSESNTSILSSVKNHILKLKQFKQILNNNKNDLTSAISILKNSQKHNLCTECERAFKHNCDAGSGVVDQINDLPTLQVDDVAFDTSEYGSQGHDRMCPLCGAIFSSSFQEFCQHVSDHFSDEENSIRNTFEVLP